MTRGYFNVIQIFLFIASFLLFSQIVLADSKKLKISRFASIKSNEVNARAGPSLKSSVEWIFIKKNEPVEVIAEYEQWRQVRDITGEGGWVHSSVLSPKRFVIVTGNSIVKLLKSPSDSETKSIVKVAPAVRCRLIKSVKDWSKVECSEYKGWLQKDRLWGVHANEEN